MTLQEGMAFGLVGLTVLAFLWGRWRFDVIALCSLAAGVLIGLIKPEDAFKGVANDIVIIIASALVLSAAVGKSGLCDVLTEADQSPGVRLRGTVSFDPVDGGTRVTERIRIAAPRLLAGVTIREGVKAHIAMLAGIRSHFESG